MHRCHKAEEDWRTHQSVPSPEFSPVGRAQHTELTDLETVPYSYCSDGGWEYTITTAALCLLQLKLNIRTCADVRVGWRKGQPLHLDGKHPPPKPGWSKEADFCSRQRGSGRYLPQQPLISCDKQLFQWLFNFTILAYIFSLHGIHWVYMTLNNEFST